MPKTPPKTPSGASPGSGGRRRPTTQSTALVPYRPPSQALIRYSPPVRICITSPPLHEDIPLLTVLADVQTTPHRPRPSQALVRFRGRMREANERRKAPRAGTLGADDFFDRAGSLATDFGDEISPDSRARRARNSAATSFDDFVDRRSGATDSITDTPSTIAVMLKGAKAALAALEAKVPVVIDLTAGEGACARVDLVALLVPMAMGEGSGFDDLRQTLQMYGHSDDQLLHTQRQLRDMLESSLLAVMSGYEGYHVPRSASSLDRKQAAWWAKASVQDAGVMQRLLRYVDRRYPPDFIRALEHVARTRRAQLYNSVRETIPSVTADEVEAAVSALLLLLKVLVVSAMAA